MATEDITLRVRIDELTRELAKVPNITQKEMKRMLSAVSASYKEQTREAEKSAREQAKAVERAAREAEKAAEKQLGALEKVADKFTGGLAGDMKDLAEAGLGPLGSAGTIAAIGLGAAAAAVAAVGLASVAAVGGVIKITQAAEDAVAALDKLGMAETISAEQRQAIDDANLALDALGVVVDQLVVSLAADFGPTVVWASSVLFDFGLTALKTLEDFTKTGDVIETFVIYLATQFVKAIAAPLTALVKLGETISWIAGMVGQSTPTIDAATEKFYKYTATAAKSITGLDGLDDAVNSNARSFTDFGVVMESLRAARAKEAAEAKGQKEAADAASKAQDRQAKSAKDAAKAERELAAAQREAKQTTEAVERATDALNRLRDQSLDPFLSDQERARKNYLDELAQIDEIIQATKERTLTAEQLYAVEQAGVEAATAARKEYQAELEKLATTAAAPAPAAAAAAMPGAAAAVGEVTSAGSVWDLLTEGKEEGEKWIQHWTEQAAKISVLLEAAVAAYQPIIDIVDQIGASWEQLHRDRLDAIMEQRDKEIEGLSELRGEERAASVERIRAMTKEANERRRQITIAFRAQQSAAVANAIIDGARAALSLIPAFSFLGPGAPGAAVAVAGAATAIQIATILSQKPKFHTGLDPSEIPAILTRGEGVANQRAMASPAFREQLSQANAGMAPAPMGGPVVIALNDRVLAQLDSRTQRITGRARGGTIALEVGTRAHYR